MHLRTTQLAAVTAVALLVGCAGSKPSAGEGPATSSGLRVEGVSNDFVEVARPTVEIDDDVMTIRGNVHRRGGGPQAISGRVDIDILGSDGQQLAWLPAVLAPNPLPSDGTGEAGYIIHYGWIPPAGSTVRVHFVDTKTAAVEDADDIEYSTGGGHGGGAVHAGGHGGGGGHHGGHMR
jgi:hypothetical protein